MAHARWSLAAVFVALVASWLLPFPVAASKPQPAVVARWLGAPASVPLGRIIDLTLRVRSGENTPDVVVQLVPSPGVEMISGSSLWTGAMAAGQVLKLPIKVRVVANGAWTLGASVTNRRPDATVQGSGAVLTVLAKSGVAVLSTDPHAALRLSLAQTADERRRLGVAPTPSKSPPASRRRSPS